MPTPEELKSEQVWQSERIPLQLKNLRARLLARHDWADRQIGIIGDYRHLKGYHRSYNWVKYSQFCTDRQFSVSETSGNRNPANGDFVAGMDLVVPDPGATEIYGRLRVAKAQGRLPMVRQVILESNPRHVHISFDRGLLTMDMQPVLDAILGVDQEGRIMVNVTVAMPQLSTGDEGAPVSTAQTLLNLRGASLKVDGEFGPLTEGAVIGAQKRYGAEAVDGIIGPETWTILIAGEDQQ